MPDADRPRLQVSLGQFLLQANVYGVVGCLCLIPAFNLWDLGVGSGWALVMLESVVIPLAWVLTSFVMIRDRAARASTITALLLATVAALLGSSIWISAPLAWKTWRLGPRSFHPIDLPVAVLLAIGVPLLTLAFVVLARRLVSLQRPALDSQSGPAVADPSLSPEP